MADVSLREIKDALKTLTSRVDKMQQLIEVIGREVGIREGHRLSDDVESIDELLQRVKTELNTIKLDTNNIRSMQEYRNQENIELKRALAAIYRNTVQIEEMMRIKKAVEKAAQS